jgi:multidrug efflux pump subunit AcrB
MMLGIIVDDAIVVGEHAATLEEQGVPRAMAAEQAGLRMMAPVTAATLTTAAAFAPIALIGGRIGDILLAIPLAALAALFASLIECFLILPGHLRHGKPSTKPPSRWRQKFDGGFDRFRANIFGPFVDMAYAWRYTTVAIMLALFFVAAGLMAGGRVNFVFFPSLPPENLQATISFAPGVPREDQIAAIKKITDAMHAAEDALVARSKAATADDDDATADDKLIIAAVTFIGKAGQNRGTNLAEAEVQLTSTEDRTTPVRDIIKAWQERLPEIPGVESVVIKGRQGGPPGRDVDVRLQNAPVEVLKAAAEELKTILRGMPATSAVDDDLPYGKQELVFEVTPRGAALGFTGQSVGRQIRNAFEGAIATRFARGDEEITVKVQRDQEQGGLAALEAFYLVSPTGERVPLREVVSVRERQNFALVIRRDGVRTVAVTANLNTDVMTTEAAVAKLEAEVMPELAKKYGLTYRYAGRAEEASDSFKDLGVGLILTLSMIYIILAWVFADYWKPIAVMAIVPFGFVGAVFGHYLMGYSLTIISMIGLLGLSGILVNDSIVMVSRLNERQKMGEDLRTAVTQAARDRLRAVLLTSITTIAGLVPLMFETSLQAQFLIPLAITIVFGVAAATLLVLVLVPSIIGIGADFAYVTKAVLGRRSSPQERPMAPAE